MVLRFGAIGAAMVWLGLTLGYFLIEVQVMHRRLLRGAQWRWYMIDIATPVLISVIILGIARLLVTATTRPIPALAAIAGAGILAFGLSALALPIARTAIRQALPFRRRATAMSGG
jgi:hypothetical protein